MAGRKLLIGWRNPAKLGFLAILGTKELHDMTTFLESMPMGVARSGRKLRLAAVLAGLVAAAGLPATPVLAQVSEGSHAAIAFSPSIYIAPEGAARGYGASWGWGSRAAAQRAAMRRCTNNDNIITDCRVVLSISRGCGAMAVGIRGVSSAVSTGEGRTLRAAQNAAMNACNRSAANCRMVVSTCARSQTAP